MGLGLVFSLRIECRPGEIMMVWLGQAISSPMRRLKVDCKVD